MGSPISPLFADLVMEDLELTCLRDLKDLHDCDPLIYFRYVDDTLLCVRRDQVDLVLSVFNSYVDCLKFTCEIEENNSLSFLDLKLLRNNNRLITNWYRKPTSSDRILNFKSNHSLQLKRNIVFNLVDRAVLLSDDVFHVDNINFVRKLLINNNYDSSFIEKHISSRLRKIRFESDNLVTNNNSCIHANNTR